MKTSNEHKSAVFTRIDHIPLVWITPNLQQQAAKLAIWLPYGTGTKEDMFPYLEQLASVGFLAMSFDPWQHGERGTGMPPEQMFTMAMGDFPNTIWPIIGQSALDVLKVIDWAMTEYTITLPVCIGGISLGGDIAVAAAGTDSRIGVVSAINATPDWLRPGMHALGQLVQFGRVGAYAQFFYENINPLTNLSGYADCPAITFECGAEDDHVPPDGALRFQTALGQTYLEQPDRLRVNLHPNVGHQEIPAMWHNSLEWFLTHTNAR
jgi:dienelactone hydrolase